MRRIDELKKEIIHEILNSEEYRNTEDFSLK